MVRSYRNREVDMVSLAKEHEKTVAIGNAHMNGRGDILGAGGKVVKSREEQLKEFYEGNRMTSEQVNLKKESAEAVKKEIEELRVKPSSKPSQKPPKPVYEDITEEEKASL